MNTSKRIPSLLLIACLLLLAPLVFAQGDLTPPGPPAPTMKTLDQIEPRTDLFNAPVSQVQTSDPDYHFVILEPGSYYLSKNLLVAKPNGIRVAAGGVTLDLNGFTIRRNSGSGGDAITVSDIGHRCAIKNGVIGLTGSPSFAYGVQCPGSPRGGLLLGLAVTTTGTLGLSAGEGWNVENCTAHDNGGGGIEAPGGVITKCTSYGNNGYGIRASDGTVMSSTASNNGLFGISAKTVTSSTAANNSTVGLDGGTVADSTAENNTGNGISARTVTGCTSIGNGQMGISASGGTVTRCVAISNGLFGILGGTAIDCVARFNTGHGIFVRQLAKDNECSENGSNGNGAGIAFEDSGIRVEGNNCYNNDWGIKSTAGTNSFIVRNSCRSNSEPPTNDPPATSNYDFDRSSNTYGPVITVNGDMSANPATSHPGANIQY